MCFFVCKRKVCVSLSLTSFPSLKHLTGLYIHTQVDNHTEPINYCLILISMLKHMFAPQPINIKRNNKISKKKKNVMYIAIANR